MVAAHAERLVAKMLRGRWRTLIQTQNDVAPSRRKNRRAAEQRIGALLNCSAQDNHSPRCHSTWQPNPGRGSTYRRGKTVQTTETTLEVGELSRAIGLATSRTKSMKVRTTGLTVRSFNVMIVT